MEPRFDAAEVSLHEIEDRKDLKDDWQLMGRLAQGMVITVI